MVRVGNSPDGACPSGNCPLGVVLVRNCPLGVVLGGIVRWELSGGELSGGSCPSEELSWW